MTPTSDAPKKHAPTATNTRETNKSPTNRRQFPEKCPRNDQQIAELHNKCPMHEKVLIHHQHISGHCPTNPDKQVAPVKMAVVGVV